MDLLPTRGNRGISSQGVSISDAFYIIKRTNPKINVPNRLRPRWLSGEFSALWTEGPKFEARLHYRPIMHVGMASTKSYVGVKCFPAGVARKFGEGVPLMCRTRHLTAVQNCEVRPEMTLVLLQQDVNITKLI
ncbi:hypothetical protein AVEN_241528-1 [Araneus ventricosus]|uniref:Uncharacterized protein n=1 Tax=Araneus ventricosus TaxID=182803 RepID=A0A4Y2LFF4_ARAVE|nr:hypothetical protein AVEN_241528-1 [Araneus ventricosus]